MVVYRDEASHEFRAIYFDSEEHTIQYSVKPGTGGVVFESAPSPTAPRYRMTYTSTGTGSARFQFEIAPPGKEFTPYIKATLRRDQP
jgi:hypothetical protein